MNSVPSQNILELRKLSDKLCQREKDLEFKEVVSEIKKIVSDSKSEIESNKTPKDKLMCYEKMCLTITGLLQKLK